MVDEAVGLLEDAGCTINRIDGPHTGSRVAGAIDFPHVNYTSPNGIKGHLGIEALP